MTRGFPRMLHHRQSILGAINAAPYGISHATLLELHAHLTARDMQTRLRCYQSDGLITTTRTPGGRVIYYPGAGLPNEVAGWRTAARSATESGVDGKQ